MCFKQQTGFVAVKAAPLEKKAYNEKILLQTCDIVLLTCSEKLYYVLGLDL